MYDTGHRDEALAKAEEAITIKRSFEAFFLKAYALSDPESSLDSANSTYVVQLLEDALRCPSDGLRKGQVSIFCRKTILCPLQPDELLKHVT